MQNHISRLMMLQRYSIRLFTSTATDMEVFAGIISHTESGMSFAFSGLAEFWVAIEKLRSVTTLREMEFTASSLQTTCNSILHAANDSR